MSRFSGREDWSGPKGDRRNKGVLRAYRAQKRAEAEARQRISLAIRGTLTQDQVRTLNDLDDLLLAWLER